MRMGIRAIWQTMNEEVADGFFVIIHITSLTIPILFMRTFGGIVNLTASPHPIKTVECLAPAVFLPW